MAYQTRVTYVVADGQREFDLAIPYLDKSHIKVTLNGSFPFSNGCPTAASGLPTNPLKTAS